MAKQDYIVALDIGSTSIRTVIAQIIPEGKPRIIGMGISGANGMRKGVIVDLDEVTQSIKGSIEKAEKIAGVSVQDIYVSVGGSHLNSIETKGVIAVGRADGEVTEDDVERVIEASQAVSLSHNQEILHIVPQKFILDNQEGIKDPVGMNGVRLEMQGILITGFAPHLKNLSKCIYNAELEINGFIVAPLAAARAVLNKRQEELGVALIDLGGGTTSLAVYEERELIYLTVIPVGASHITNDVAIGLRTSIDVAEKVKVEYGSALPSEIGKQEQINLSEIDPSEEGAISRQHVAEIIEARFEEILIMVEKELKNINKSALLPAGAVLTGGGAKLQGTVDVAKETLKLPAQVGFPIELSGLIDKVDDPSFSVAIGMILWGMENDATGFSGEIDNNKNGFGKRIFNSVLAKETVGDIKKWFKKFF
ncbi:MAG: cell division protein FtsA [Patescibacteria group bacterium]|jgi:cell division protein FtsA|nr:cell division protein FtsA [Patescibacteria group bacterium]